ncbi:hypothetical protein [Halobellus salinisoli]|uniref:hypothetical protein n=1 Tax=Halobellus salinisoli TaxID=3108500 RepID=UPI003008EEA2
MSAADLPVSITGTQMLVVAVAALAVVGAGPGLISDALSGGPDQLAPPGVSDSRGPTAEIGVTTADPPNVRNDEGTAGVVAGTVGGSLMLDQPADRVDLVVRSRLPNGSWTVQHRTSIEPVDAREIALDEALGPRFTYLDGDQSNGFDVDTPGSSVRRTGAISVTARLFVDGEEIESVTDTDEYGFFVDRPAATTTDTTADERESSGSEDEGDESRSSQSSTSETDVRSAGDGPAKSDGTVGGSGDSGDGGDGDESPDVGDAGDSVRDDDAGDDSSEDEADRRTLLFGTDNALPGSTGEDTVTVSNPADEAVTATVAVGAPIDEENGLTEPESEVDETPEVGELSEYLDVKIWVETEDGRQRNVVGGDGNVIGGNGYVPLADAAESSKSLDLDPDESVTVVVEWRIAGDVGNEIQSDSTTLSVHCSFESTTTLSSPIPLL